MLSGACSGPSNDRGFLLLPTLRETLGVSDEGMAALSFTRFKASSVVSAVLASVRSKLASASSVSVVHLVSSSLWALLGSGVLIREASVVALAVVQARFASDLAGIRDGCWCLSASRVCCLLTKSGQCGGCSSAE